VHFARKTFFSKTGEIIDHRGGQWAPLPPHNPQGMFAYNSPGLLSRQVCSFFVPLNLYYPAEQNRKAAIPYD
jgi:hypothetical protein